MSDIEKRRAAHDDTAAGADPQVTRFLRDEYRAPATPGYWDGLESRIMSRVRESVRQSVRASGSVPAVAVEWWQVLSGWIAPGAWAAGIAALIALGVTLQARAAERRIAYAAVLEASAVGAAVGNPSDDATRRPDRIVRPDDAGAARHRRSAEEAAREAALRDLIAPR